MAVVHEGRVRARPGGLLLRLRAGGGPVPRVSEHRDRAGLAVWAAGSLWRLCGALCPLQGVLWEHGARPQAHGPPGSAPPAPRPPAGLPAGQKLFSCHVCSNAFSTKGSLKVHMRLHTGAKPFQCPHCELRFRTSGRRKTHMQFHDKPDPRKARKPAARSASEGLQPVNLLSPAAADPNVFIMNNSVLTGQLEQSVLQQGLVGQAVLPASVSGEPAARGGPGSGDPAGGRATCLLLESSRYGAAGKTAASSSDE